MKCPKCQFDNKEEAKFCKKCGTKLELACPSCGHPYEEDSLFCEQCGQRVDGAVAEEREVVEAEGERKHVTVLFSDLSGYTPMSEKLDPEELKEITTSIFSQVSKVIDKYEGFVEKFVGDAVMVLFGVPNAHEDDPIRALKAAREIHELVDKLSPELEKKIGLPISMHTGINTGLVVTGEVDMQKGTHGVAGGTINLASRLSNLANEGEILVGPDTYRQAEGHFRFESLEPTKVKGKAEPIQVHKVLSAKDRPDTIHRLSGLRADLIGRKAEIDKLQEAIGNLRRGKGSIFSICGDAGTGKSRLVEEFRNKLNVEEIQWIEGHAYAYSQNIPYFPFIDLLNRVLQIEEEDLPEILREKVESGIEHLIGKKDDAIPYVGSLYSLTYPEVEDVSPEFWRSRLQEAAQNIISAIAKRAPTIFFLEDLHWADPSFVELLRNALLNIRQPAIVLCVYRPIFTLLTNQQLSGIDKIYQEIRLQELSPSEAQDMLESLLKTETIPSDVKLFVQQKAEGNPFYLEEFINSLIESETLIRDNGNWKISKPITETEISPTIHGLISGRLDRLEKETKRILQEASVIGRAFLYDILKRISELEDRIDRGLSTLERLDLIRARALQPDLEYMFKHALTHEVVYNGLLKKERQQIHERIAVVMEQVFQDRLSEFYETLAFHYKQGQSIPKAVDYLMKSGEKSLKRYAVEESHQYYKEAFELLSNKPAREIEENRLLIDLILKWALVYYYRGDIKGWTDLFKAHKDLAESIDDKKRLGMFYAWLGFAFLGNDNKNSNHFLRKALEIGENLDDKKIIGYSCTWLIFTCADLGLIEEAIHFGKRAQEISKLVESDQYLYFKSLGGLAVSYWEKGDSKKMFELGKLLLEYGQKHSNIRSQTMGLMALAGGYNIVGDSLMQIEYLQKGVEVSGDPMYDNIIKVFLGQAYLLNDQIREAEKPLREALSFCQDYNLQWVGTLCSAFLGVIDITKGKMREGLRLLEEALQIFAIRGRRFHVALAEIIIGKVFSKIVEGAGPLSPLIIAKNIGFIVKNIPFASKKAEKHFIAGIEIAEEIGAKGILGQAYLDLGLLHKAKKRNNQARECILKAIEYFEQCEAEIYLKQAKEALAPLG